MNKVYKIQLPHNKEAQNIRTNIKNGAIEVEVELKEKWEPRDGEICYVEGNYHYVFIFKEVICDYVLYSYINLCLATDTEKQLLFDALAKKGKMWDAQKKAVVDLPRWRAKKGEEYCMVIVSPSDIKIFEHEKTDNHSLRESFVLKENQFKTLQSAKKVAEQIREIFKTSKAE